jgi:hypothetical protein
MGLVRSARVSAARLSLHFVALIILQINEFFEVSVIAASDATHVSSSGNEQRRWLWRLLNEEHAFCERSVPPFHLALTLFLFPTPLLIVPPIRIKAISEITIRAIRHDGISREKRNSANSKI